MITTVYFFNGVLQGGKVFTYPLSQMDSRVQEAPIQTRVWTLAMGVLVDDADINNLTPLMIAVTANKPLGAVDALVSHGADLLATPHKGWTLLDLAINKELEEAVKFLFHEVVIKGALVPVIAKQKDLFHQTLFHRLDYRGELFFEKFITYIPKKAVHEIV
ncbi:MAG: hypothetical protein Q9180_004056 [Flavoplaca navasiana]